MTAREKIIQNIDMSLKWAKDFNPEYGSTDLNLAALVGYYSGVLKGISDDCGLDYKISDFSTIPEKKRK